MTDSKPFASLSSSLLARKGNAKPAMRPQGFNDFGNGFTGTLEDLGWNDMGPEDEYPHHHTSLGLTPAPGGHSHDEPEPSYESEYDEADDEPTQPLLAQKPHAQTSAVPIPIESARNAAEPVDPEPVDAESSDWEDVDPEQIEFEEAGSEPVDQEPVDAEPVDAEPTAQEPAPPPAFVAPPPVVEQQRALRDSFEEAEVVVELPRRRASLPSIKPKAAFTLRLDPERHLKLRLASAITRRSAQQLVTGALDDFFNSLPEIEALAERVPAEAGQRSR